MLPPRLLLFTVLTFCGHTSIATAQKMSGPSSSSSTSGIVRYVPSRRPQFEMNRWRAVPVELQQQVDLIAPALRIKRDLFWDGTFPPAPAGTGIAYSHGSYVSSGIRSKPLEFTVANTGFTWITGTFESYHVFETTHQGGIYTEMNIRVLYTFSGVADPHISPGKLVDIAMRGGTIRRPDGVVKDFLTDDPEPLLQPSHTYLLQIIPCSYEHKCDGDFFSLGRSWDLTGLTIQPVDPFDVRVYKDQLSVISGRPAESVIPAFQQILTQVSSRRAQALEGSTP